MSLKKISTKFINYIKLIRVKHWIKNLLIMIPAFFGGVILEPEIIITLLLGFLIFSFCSSAIYVINDLCDIEKDRQHPIKCKRPIASGAVSKIESYIILAVLILASMILNFYLCKTNISVFIPILYLILNVLYSKSLKNKPVIDIVILVSGFVLRMVYGSLITSVQISSWLYLTLITLSLFFSFSKRRNEKMVCGESTRAVLNYYSERYLNSNMYMYLAIFMVFYALWSVDTSTLNGMIYTTPIVIVIIMRYTYTLEKSENGNPVDMILGDKILILLGIFYIVLIFSLIYFPEVINEYLRF